MKISDTKIMWMIGLITVCTLSGTCFQTYVELPYICMILILKGYLTHRTCTYVQSFPMRRASLRALRVCVCYVCLCSKQEDPTLVGSLSGKNVVYLAAGAHYSVALTEEGLLYTWGKGSYGRLGHGECVC